MQKIFLTFFYTGLSPKAPGTVGTFASLILAIILIQFFPASTLFLISLLVAVLAIKEIDKYEENGGPHDDKSIVIDEFAGVFLAFSMTDPSAQNWVIPAVLSFILFRYFDIAKPSVIGKIDQNTKGGLGVVGDDMVAGFFAGITANLIMYVSKNYFGF